MYKQVLKSISFLLAPILAVFGIMGNGVVSFIDHIYIHDPLITFNRFIYTWQDVNNGTYSIISNGIVQVQSVAQVLLTKYIGISDSTFSFLLIYIPLLVLLISFYFTIKTFNIGKNAPFLLTFMCSVLGLYSVNTAILLSFGWSLNAILQLGFGLFSFSLFIRSLNNQRYLLPIAALLNIITFSLIQLGIVFAILSIIYVIFLHPTKLAFKYLAIYLLMSIAVNIAWIGNYIYASIFLNEQYYSSDALAGTLTKSNDVLRRLLVLSHSNHGLNTIVGDSINNHGRIIARLYLDIITIIGVLFIKNRKEKKIVIFLLSIFLLASYLAMGPDSIIYTYMFSHIPLFYIFRSYSKFTIFASVSMTIMLSYLLLEINKIKIKFIFYLFIFSYLILTLYSSWPLASGNLGGLMTPYIIPEYYSNLLSYLKSNNIEERILVLPSPHWFSDFKWTLGESQTVNPLKTILQNYVYDETSQSNYNSLQKHFVSYISAPHCVDRTIVMQYATLLNIQYILLQKDQNRLHSLNYRSENVFQVINDLALQDALFVNFGDLDLVKIPIEYSSDLRIPEKTANFGNVFISENFITQYLDMRRIPWLVTNSKIKLNDVKKHNPTKYSFDITYPSGTIPIAFSQNFSKGWILKLKNISLMDGRELKVNSEKWSSHEIIDTYGNIWFFEFQKMCDALNICENKSEVRTLKYELEFRPQRHYLVSQIMGMMVVLLAVTTSFILFKKARN